VNEETIRTKALNYTRDHLKVIVSVGLTSIVWLVVQSFSVGAYREKIDQMDKHMESIDQKQEAKADVERQDRQQMKDDLSEIKTTVRGMDARLGRVEDWRDGIRRDVQDANAVKIPKLTMGHRTRK